MTGRPRWRITSDGTPAGTRVHLGDVDVSHAVRAVAFRLPDPNGFAEVSLELSGYAVDLDVEAPRADVTVAPCPVCSAGIRCDAHPAPDVVVDPCCYGCAHEPHGLKACPVCGCEWTPS